MVWVSLLVVASTPFEDAVLRAKAAYQEAALEQALGELGAAEALAQTDADRVVVLLAKGAVLARVPNQDAATLAWERGLSLDPNAALPFPVSAKVRADFETVRSTVSRFRPPPPEAPPSASRFVVPGILVGLAAVAGGVGLGLGVNARTTHTQSLTAAFQDDRDRLYASATSQATLANGFFVGAGVLAVASLVAFLVVGLG